MNLCPEYTLFKDQMMLHAISNFNRDESYTNITPNSRWTLDDYKGLHYYIRVGFLVEGDGGSDDGANYPDCWCARVLQGDERPLWDFGMEIQTE
tara:strand:- start:861 stop:1142 length:282 start_codon:yes stop_codon:yes gene_type:complete